MAAVRRVTGEFAGMRLGRRLAPEAMQDPKVDSTYLTAFNRRYAILPLARGRSRWLAVVVSANGSEQ